MLKIALSAGHGGRDLKGNPVTPGKRTPDGSMLEWEFNSAAAKHFIEIMKGYEGVEIVKVSDIDTGHVDTPLRQRTDKANAEKVDLYIAIHANASGDIWSDACGIEVFTYLKASAQSTKIANEVQKQLIKSSGLRDRGVKQANLHEVREPKAPAILVEAAFMSNHKEAELLKTDEFRKKTAQAIALGLENVYGLKKKETQKTETKVNTDTSKLYRVQVGSFSNKSNAETLLKELQAKGYKDAYIKEV
jgi:N-acetylmuramoyl-L-alanine amidase